MGKTLKQFPQFQQIVLKVLFTGFLTITFFSFGGRDVAAQVTGADSPQNKETANKADKDLKSMVRVNPSTLAMEFNVSLISYPGRNGNNLSVGFSYSSKLWRMQDATIWWYWVNTNKKYITDIRTLFAEKTAAGWTSNLVSPRMEEKTQIYDETGQLYDPLIDEAGLSSIWGSILHSFTESNLLPSDECYGFICCSTYLCTIGSSSQSENCRCSRWSIARTPEPEPPLPPPPPQPMQLYYVRKLQVTMSNGSTHEFRSSDIPIHCGNTSSGCIISDSGDGTYLSVDSSGMKLVRDENTSVLYMPDGGRYLFDGLSPFATKYVDQDGNIMTFSSINDTTTGQSTSKWIDSLGREITDPMQINLDTQRQSPGRREFSLPGPDGHYQRYSITWSLLKPIGCETSTDPNCVGTDGVSGGALEDQSQKLFYETRYFCRGNLTTDLLTNPNDINDPANEVLFPLKDIGIRPCNGFDVERDSDGEIIVDQNGNAIPYPIRFNPVVLSEIVYPNGKKYEFKYNRYGEITKITKPTGSFETFSYSWIRPIAGVNNLAFDQTNRGVTERRVFDKNGVLIQRWTYSVQHTDGIYKVVMTAPQEDNPLGMGTRTERYLIPAYSDGSNFGFDNPLGGMQYDERIYAENDYSNPRSRILTEWISKNSSTVARDPRIRRTLKVTIENGRALAVLNETEYDDNGSLDPEHFSHLNVKRTKSHHFQSIPLSLAQTGTFEQIAAYFNSSTLATLSETDYLYDANYKAHGIASLPIENRSLNPVDNSTLTKTQTKYDNLLPNISTGYPSGYITQTYGISSDYNCGLPSPNKCWVDPNTQYRGKPTTYRLWDSTNNIWIETHTRYDIFGNAIAVRDPIGNETITLFEDTTAKPYKYAYPTRVDTPSPDPTNIHGTNEGSYTTKTYDFMTGLPLTVTDEFGQTTVTEYNDPLLRPTRVYGANFSTPETQTIYDDDNLTVTVRKQIDTNNWDEVTTYSDSLGRILKTKTKDSQGDVFVETKYDLLGRVQMVTNPYRQGDTVLWSLTEYDELGRVKQTREPVENQNLDSPTGNILRLISYDISTVPSYVGLAITTSDSAGKKVRTITNALGQIIVVEEPNYQGNLDPLPQSIPDPSPTPTPSPGGGGEGQCLTPQNCQPNFTGEDYPSYATFYRYNALGKMVEVTQGVQKRWFKYDSLGRLIRVRQPEQDINAELNMADEYNTSGQWTAGFTYDVLGNVLTATDANGVIITNTYDKANRVTTRTYSDDTPSVSFYYDGKGLSSTQSPNYAKGKLTRVASSVSETQYQIFDNLGRVTQVAQITDGQTYTSKYTYNLSGALVMEEYPSGRVVMNEYRTDGDLLKVTSKKPGGSVFTPYVSNFHYTASGGISQMRLGNGRWETAKFNARLQVTELGLGAGSADASVWRTTYEYGELQRDGTVDTSKNTGNIARQTLSFSGLTSPLVQSYEYDSLYRLTEAKETGGANLNWVQSWSYDRYGNRTAFSQNIAGNTEATNMTIDAATNRFISGQGFGYDKNGNVIADIDPLSSLTRQFVYNGDNRQTEVKRDGVTIARYFYDGEGKRVKKITNTETTVFVYSAGKLIAEYSTQLSRTPQTKYLTQDHLGTPRIITNEFGAVVSRRDFMPFGEELHSGVGARSAALQYGTNEDTIRQKFTAYERDNESELDYAQARMYNYQHGRFTAVDPLLVSADPTNPQSWNRYIYCFNNPLIFIDPSGEITGDYYDKDGKWLFTDNINDDKVYLATPTTTAEGATNYEVQELAITHTQFKIISNIVKQEGATDDTNEYLWIAHASNNEAQATNRSLYGLLMSSFSSVSNKTGLSTRDDSLRANAARAGVIDVLTGGADPTDGARRWDGTDFLAWGERQNKFKEYGSIVIREDIFNNYLNSQGGNSVSYGGRQYVLPADVFNRNKNPNNWGNWNRDGISEFGFKYIKNRERGILYATGTAGKSIFWSINYKWVK